MKMLGIVGSPRRGGNTEILVDEILAGAEDAGANTEKVILHELDIKPCRACNSCYKTGNCVQDDDMESLFEKMKESEVWILGTPIYWWGPTAQFKAFMDRWYHPKHQEFKKQRVIVVIPLGGGHERYARHTVGIFTDVLNYLEMDLFEMLVTPGFNRRGEVRNNEGIIARARTIGKKALEN